MGCQVDLEDVIGGTPQPRRRTVETGPDCQLNADISNPYLCAQPLRPRTVQTIGTPMPHRWSSDSYQQVTRWAVAGEGGMYRSSRRGRIEWPVREAQSLNEDHRVSPFDQLRPQASYFRDGAEAESEWEAVSERVVV